MADHPAAPDPRDALEGVLARFDGVREVRDLAGGRGRTVAVDRRDGTAVVHLRTGTEADLEREARATTAAHAGAVGPEVLAVVPELGALVTRWIPGRVLEAGDLADDDVVAGVAAAIRSLHDLPVPEGTWPLDPTADSFAYMDDALRRGLGTSRADRVERERLELLAESLDSGSGVRRVLCHGDLVPQNLVLGDDCGAVSILDYEYAGAADPAYDLGGLAAIAELDDERVAALVDAYGANGGVTVERVMAWRGLTRYAWTAWVALDPDLGPERERWVAWATRAKDGWQGGRPG